jgi:hypothetical protein
MSNIFEIVYNQAGDLRYTYATANSIGEAENKCGISKDWIKSIHRLKDAPQVKNNVEANPRKKIYYQVKKMDELEKFCLPPDIQSWIMKYDAGSEQALVKQVPLTPDNISMIDRLAGMMLITRRYRGPRHNSRNFTRDCPKKDAERVSIYLKERVA